MHRYWGGFVAIAANEGIGMEFTTENLLPRILLTLNTLGYSLGPALVDFSPTHATNPLWTPHARFHVVWQVSSYLGIGLIALGLIWLAGPLAPQRLYLAGLIATAVYAGFFATAFAMPVYGGKLVDVNGVPPFTTVQAFGRNVAFDRNTTAFCVQVVILIAALLTIR
jgi:hypothetical protein